MVTVVSEYECVCCCVHKRFHCAHLYAYLVLSIVHRDDLSASEDFCEPIKSFGNSVRTNKIIWQFGVDQSDRSPCMRGMHADTSVGADKHGAIVRWILGRLEEVLWQMWMRVRQKLVNAYVRA